MRDFLDRHRILFREGTLRADHPHELVPENRGRLQAGRLHWQSDNSDVERACFEFLNDLVGEVPIDIDLHTWMQARIFCEHIRQDIQAGALISAN